ncbi:MAG: hypothetical protein A2X36_01505 [Elusimicrobia bacterium GWA2_69_24]|nr:MAG: hypothetical protein A2X36_01505 [Elusimicrobia bacterium GWA2_69_24]HBL17120.1 hypothetical protein [Elusimicrobiota bacterium]
MKEVALALALLAAAQGLAARSVRPPYPALDQMRLGAEDAVTGAALLSLGMRRLAADLAFIRLLIYYGTPEDEGGAHDDGHGHGSGTHGEEDYGAGCYAELGPRIQRILDMDPFWKYPVLYGAGALAFNLKRPEEALALLRQGLAAAPRDPQYLSTLAAVGLQQRGDTAQVIGELTPLLADPETPTMIKHLVAFMNQRLGRREEAIRLYREILDSRDDSYRALAREALGRMKAPV